MNQIEKRGQTVDVVQFPSQGGRQVEAEAVDMHLEDPVAEGIHDQLGDKGGLIFRLLPMPV